MKGTLILLHGGGPTAVINASLYGAICQAKRESDVGRIYAAIGGTGGLLRGEVKDITSEDYLKTGDAVVVYGELYNFNGTHEMNKGNYLYSLNGSTDPIAGIQAVAGDSAVPAAIFDLSGRRVSRAGQGLYIVNGKKVVF